MQISLSMKLCSSLVWLWKPYGLLGAVAVSMHLFCSSTSLAVIVNLARLMWLCKQIIAHLHRRLACMRSISCILVGHVPDSSCLVQPHCLCIIRDQHGRCISLWDFEVTEAICSVLRVAKVHVLSNLSWSFLVSQCCCLLSAEQSTMQKFLQLLMAIDSEWIVAHGQTCKVAAANHEAPLVTGEIELQTRLLQVSSRSCAGTDYSVYL